LATSNKLHDIQEATTITKPTTRMNNNNNNKTNNNNRLITDSKQVEDGIEKGTKQKV